MDLRRQEKKGRQETGRILTYTHFLSACSARTHLSSHGVRNPGRRMVILSKMVIGDMRAHLDVETRSVSGTGMGSRQIDKPYTVDLVS
ncbi:hypothetical protein FIBSPDRAFT_496155 [Athelia psychrophila]|uniref:Uncharacterized protein n=1 Tax=Athelia psychrophila TaxID=1759441 RepID=A0A166KKJ4_9AGAM|nr:hypothetical protein FIBSPDRAFT_496155 [Fibularhizoctonia sp. CBS 109695]